MKKFLLVLSLTAAGLLGVIIGYNIRNSLQNIDYSAPFFIEEVKKPLNKYTIESLATVIFEKSEIKIEKELAKNRDFRSFLFTLDFDPSLTAQEKSHVSGLANIPAGSGPFPAILMIRGYVDQEIYQTGMGTARVAEVFAKAGFITIAPDFLGYGQSSENAVNIFESRFQTYTTVLALLENLDSLQKWDQKNLFFWAHSNGGQIALTVLTITQKEIPTSLWAPVTKPFPYNVLYYTDEAEDGGKLIRQELSKFEEIYDANDFSFTNYLERIKAPLILHQGTEDDSVPVFWSNEFSQKLKERGLLQNYFVYKDADHNLVPAWDEVVSRDLKFYNSHIE